MRVMRRSWQHFRANPIVLSPSKGQRRNAKASEGANDVAGANAAAAIDPELFGQAVAAE